MINISLLRHQATPLNALKQPITATIKIIHTALFYVDRGETLNYHVKLHLSTNEYIFVKILMVVKH